MKSINQYIIELRMGQQYIWLPKEAKILKLDWQGANLCLWALVRPDFEPEERTIDMIGTGVLIHDSYRFQAMYDYVNTIQNKGITFHVFISK